MKIKDKSPILIVCGAGYVSGREVVALELGQGLARTGETVSFITSFWNDGDFLNRLELAGLPKQREQFALTRLRYPVQVE